MLPFSSLKANCTVVIVFKYDYINNLIKKSLLFIRTNTIYYLKFDVAIYHL